MKEGREREERKPQKTKPKKNPTISLASPQTLNRQERFPGVCGSGSCPARHSGNITLLALRVLVHEVAAVIQRASNQGQEGKAGRPLPAGSGLQPGRRSLESSLKGSVDPVDIWVGNR